MALALDDIVRVKFRAAVYNEEIQWQQTYRMSTVAAGDTLQQLYAIASFFQGDVAFGGPSAVTTAWLNMLGASVATYKFEAQKIWPQKTIYVQREGAINGTGGTGPRATNTCAVFTLVSALPGRSQQAKYHVGPLADAYMVQGALSSTALANLRALAQACQQPQPVQFVAPGDLVLTPVVFHRNPNANPRWNDVQSYRLNFYVRTQRRRTVKVGK